MKNFRYIGIEENGHVTRGIVPAADKKSARKNIKMLEIKRSIRVRKIVPERTFVYKAQKDRDKPVRGEQRAFERSDVETALRKLGYKVLYVRRKLFPILLRPSYKDIVIFIRVCADMLRDKLPYDEILQLLSMDMENKTLKRTLREIGADLKNGKDGKDVFCRHEHIFGKFPAYMLGVASTSGDMAAVYDSTARFLERNEEFKKSLRQALVMPAVVMVFMIAAVMFYIAYIFPKTAELFTKYDIEIPPMTAATMTASNIVQNNFLAILLCGIVFVFSFIQFMRSGRGRYLIDKYIIKLPYVGSLLHKTSIEIFARVFHTLYSESGENITVIRIAAEACRNKFIESRIVTVAIPLMLKDGTGLVESLEATGVFTKTALSRLRSGAETGALKYAALQLANYYENETSYKLKGCIEWINVSVSVLIVLIVIALTIVSSETAVMSPKMPGLNY